MVECCFDMAATKVRFLPLLLDLPIERDGRVGSEQRLAYVTYRCLLVFTGWRVPQDSLSKRRRCLTDGMVVRHLLRGRRMVAEDVEKIFRCDRHFLTFFAFSRRLLHLPNVARQDPWTARTPCRNIALQHRTARLPGSSTLQRPARYLEEALLVHAEQGSCTIAFVVS